MSTVKGFARVELLIPFTVDVDDAEYDEWRGGDEPSGGALIEYLKASPDWWQDIEIEEPSWRHEITSYDIETTEHAEPVPCHERGHAGCERETRNGESWMVHHPAHESGDPS